MDIKDLLFLIYRMMPFIIVAFLVISSLFSGDFSGFLLLVGIMISSLITIAVSSFVVKGIEAKDTTKMDDWYKNLHDCNILTINETVLSFLPLSTHTFAFIFGYFIYVIVTNKLVIKNALLIAMVTILVFIDVLYIIVFVNAS